MTMLGSVLDSAAVFTDGDWIESKDQDPEGDVRLVQLADVGVGQYLDKSSRFMTSTKAAELGCTFLEAGDLLIARMPDPLGRACIFPGRPTLCVTVVDVCIIRPDLDVVDSRYLMHWFNSPGAEGRIERKSTGTTRRRISRKNIGLLDAPLPPIEEQRRIAAVLDAADELRTNRRQALAKLDTLTQAIFIDMFGDPVVNPRGWNKKPLIQLLDRIENGKSPVCKPEIPADGEWGVLKAGAVTYCKYDPDASKTLPDDIEPHADAEVRDGDVLFARKNTHDLVAACAYVRSTPPRRLLSDLIFRLVIADEQELLPVYLQQVLISPNQRRTVQSLAGGAAGSMPNISKAKLMTVEIPVPDRQSQRSFVDAVEASVKVSAAIERSGTELDALFASLQQRAFAGEL